MPTEARFREVLTAAARAPVADASPLEVDEDFRLLIDALARLETQPDLLGGDPNGVFTYEDPILAVAADFVRRAEEAPVANAGDGRELSNGNLLRWALAGISAWRTRGDRAWGDLGGRVPRADMTVPQTPSRIALVGDAGYRSTAQQRVLDAMQHRHRDAPFHLGIHLGDTYFAGSEAETLTNLLQPLARLPFGFVALCGNHDLYYGPSGYAAAITILKQPGRYFSVELPHWRLVCLDTSLASERLLRNEGQLDHGQLDWLDSVLQKKDGRRTVLFSHHYVVSDWSSGSNSLLAQLRDRLHGVFAWYWGHEHQLVAYRRSEWGVYGACVGNGAFLNERRGPRAGAAQAEWTPDDECTCYPGVAGFRAHGWLELEFRPDGIAETYHLEGRPAAHQRLLRTE